MVPGSRNSLRFKRVAWQRFGHAEFLLEQLPDSGQTAVYLAGYCVECIFKAMILSRTPANRPEEIPKTHKLERLRQQYYRVGGEQMPRSLVRDFARVGTWTVDIRYEPGIMQYAEARRFLDSVFDILKWAEGRL